MKALFYTADLISYTSLSLNNTTLSLRTEKGGD